MMNLSTDLDRRWSQSPKSIMVQGDPTSTAEDQSVEVNRLESQAEVCSQAASVGPAQHLNRQVHQVQQQLNQLESVLSQLPADQISHRLQNQITSHWQQAVAVQAAHIPAIELSLTS